MRLALSGGKTMEIECIGKKSGNGLILIDPLLIDQAKIGSTIKLKITVPDEKEKKDKEGLDPATMRILERMENAKPLGVPDDPEELSHSRLMEERMDEKFPYDSQGKKKMDSATQRFLARLENAPRLGQIKGDLSREDIYEDRADERF